MDVIEFSVDQAREIERYSSFAASSVELAHGRGESHVYAVYIEPGGSIGSHEAGFDQLFLIVRGSGWASDADGAKYELREGQGAVIRKGEMHSKGSDAGMFAIMVQASAFSD